MGVNFFYGKLRNTVTCQKPLWGLRGPPPPRSPEGNMVKRHIMVRIHEVYIIGQVDSYKYYDHL